MNDTTKVEDRFHETPLKVSYGRPPKPQPTKGLKMAYCPQGVQAMTVAKAGYKFTEDQVYDVLERKDYKIKIIDDSGAERWVKEDYFTLADQYLMHDKDCGFTRVEQPNILWQGLEIEAKSPEVRKVKFHEDPKDESFVAIMASIPSSCAVGKDSPPKKLNQEFINLKSETTKEELEKNKKFFEQTAAPLGSIYQVDSFGKENALLMDIDKLWEKMGNVFPEYRKINSDGLMDFIKVRFPNRKFDWKCGLLHVDGCSTNIKKADVNEVFNGLKKLTTPKMADKLVGKVIVSKLKKLL